MRTSSRNNKTPSTASSQLRSKIKPLSRESQISSVNRNSTSSLQRINQAKLKLENVVKNQHYESAPVSNLNSDRLQEKNQRYKLTIFPEEQEGQDQSSISKIAPYSKIKITKQQEATDSFQNLILSYVGSTPTSQVPHTFQMFGRNIKTAGLYPKSRKLKLLDRQKMDKSEFFNNIAQQLSDKNKKQKQVDYTQESDLEKVNDELQEEFKKPSSIQDLKKYDQLKIEEMNEYFLKKQQKLTAQVSSPEKKTKNLGQSPLRKQKRLTTFNTKINFFPATGDPDKDMPETDDYVEKNKIGNELLARVKSLDYAACYKNFDRIKDYQQLYQQKPNLYVQMISASQEHRTFPKKLGLVQNQELITSVQSQKQLNLKPYAQVFKSGMNSPQCSNLITLNLSDNLLSTKYLQELFSLNYQTLREIHLSNVSLNLEGLNIIIRFLQSSRIKKLNLEQNKFGDQGCISIINYLLDNRTVTSLNLSKNNISTKSCESFAKLFKKTQYLAELYLHYNNINQVGGTILFKALIRNSSIKVLDLSHNNLGNSNTYAQQTKASLDTIFLKNLKFHQSITECTVTISKILQKTTDLVHLDLSYNGFTEFEAEEIAKGLNQNQSIYGFHFEGNSPKYAVNKDGFLLDQSVKEEKEYKVLDNLKLKNYHVDFDEEDQDRNYKLKDEEIDIQHMHRSRRIDSVKKVRENWQLLNQKFLDTCWICEGWQEIRFKWIPGKSGQLHSEPLFIHLNIYDYQPLLMTFLKQEFFIDVMCPPNYKMQYFFTNPVQGIQTIAHDQASYDMNFFEEIKKEKVEFYYNQDILVEGDNLNQINFMFNQQEGSLIDSSKNYIPQILVKPREDFKKYDFNPKSKQFSGWSIENSIFNNYQPDNPALINECFEFDFASSKIARLVRDSEAPQVKETLRSYYPYLFNAYKFYASSGSLGNV